MKEVGMQQLLMQMRAMSARVEGLQPDVTESTSASGFSKLLTDAVDQVNGAQKQAAALAEGFEKGAEGVDLTDVMVSLQKADVSFRAITEVRNKLLNAYQEIMNMPV